MRWIASLVLALFAMAIGVGLVSADEGDEYVPPPVEQTLVR